MIIESLGLRTVLRYLKNKKAICLAILLIVQTFPAGALDKISRIDFEDAPVINVVQALARSAGLDLVLAGDQNSAQAKKATIHLKDLPAEEAIENILRTNGFSYEQRGRVLLVSTLPQDQSNTGYQGKAEVIQLKYISAEKAKAILAKLVPGAISEVGERSNSLIIKARDSEVTEMKELLSKIDKITPQILIESKVIEISQSDSVRLGISYGNGTIRLNTAKDNKKTSLADDISSNLNYLIASGRANVIASPRIATLDNQEALINIGNRIPYAVPVASGSSAVQWSVEYIDAGVKLKITPQLGKEGYITTFIKPEVSSISEWRTTAAGDFPVISTRNASATVRVKDGEAIVIGGLLSESERENVTRVPVLGYLPGIGPLFQNRSTEKSKTEIVFMITPHLL